MFWGKRHCDLLESKGLAGQSNTQFILPTHRDLHDYQHGLLSVLNVCWLLVLYYLHLHKLPHLHVHTLQQSLYLLRAASGCTVLTTPSMYA